MGPTYNQPPLDPEFLATKARADQDRTAAIQGNLSDYQARLLQRFGASTAFSGTGTGSPLIATPLMSAGLSGSRVAGGM
ncbi:MAG: hypothetical protein IT562_10825 [Alphaproteobacteria bacterium]|nr:hypothetical protein [Alphaproteobacteria bacterium]